MEEVRHRTNQLRESKEQLVSAVARVGHSADAVRHEMGK